MPLLYKFDDQYLIHNTSNQFVIDSKTTLKQTEVGPFIDRLKNSDVADILNCILNVDASVCHIKTNNGETALSIAIYRVILFILFFFVHFFM